MKMFRTLIVIALAVFFVGQGLAQDATAPTVTFNVPIQFSNLHPDVLSVDVACSVIQAGQKTLGESHLTLNVPADGNINQTVTIVVSQKPGEDITLANVYGVGFGFRVAGIGSVVHPDQESDTPVAYRAQAGTPFAREVSGQVTW